MLTVAVVCWAGPGKAMPRLIAGGVAAQHSARGAPSDAPMRPLVVVVGDEGVELGLEGVEVLTQGLAPQPALERLLEALHLAAGLGVVGPGDLGHHPNGPQLDLEADLEAPQAPREVEAVTAQLPEGDAPGSGPRKRWPRWPRWWLRPGP